MSTNSSVQIKDRKSLYFDNVVHDRLVKKETFSVISKRYGICVTTAVKWFQEYQRTHGEVPNTRNRGYKSKLYDTVVAAYVNDGMTMRQIAEKYSISPSTVSVWVSIFADSNGVTMDAIKSGKVKVKPAESNPAPPSQEVHEPTPSNPAMEAEESSPSNIQSILSTVDTLTSDLLAQSPGNPDLLKLKKALKMAMLREHALDVMIDIAEETFNIPIRKKSGAKQ